MDKKVSDLHEFIERAVKSRKYPDPTARGLKAALKLFEGVLNDDEKDSLNLFKKNIEQIYRDVSTQNGKAYNASSLAAYKSRVLKIISDFEKYGLDPTKMASWNPKVITRSPRKKNSATHDESPLETETGVGSSSSAMIRLEMNLRSERPDQKFLILVPNDISSAECRKIKAVLDSLVSDTE